MKAEERKELEQNSLLRVINSGFQDIKTGPSKTVWYVIGGLALVGALVGGWFWYSYEQKKKNSGIWAEVDAAKNVEALKKVADDNRGTTQAHSADLQRARIRLREGLTTIYNVGDYDKAKKALEEAIELFDKVAGQFDKTIPLLAQESLLGAGKAKEALGKLDEAKSYYSKVVTKDEGREYKDKTSPSVYAVEAQKGVTRIDAQKAALTELNQVLQNKPQ